MKALAGHVAELTTECLDALAAAEPPDRDLHALLSVPLPALVISELLGVPRADRGYFGDLSTRISRFGAAADSAAAMTELVGYTAGLLFAGHETTATRIDLGVLILLADPARRAAVRSGAVDDVIEEVLRLAAPGDLGLLRYAQEDVEIDGVRIAAGEAVLLAPSAVNRDPAAFAEPETFDPARRPQQLAFGHGAHFCLGAGLARVELRIVFPLLFRRFPNLRTTVDVDRLVRRADQLTGGLAALPVSW